MEARGQDAMGCVANRTHRNVSKQTGRLVVEFSITTNGNEQQVWLESCVGLFVQISQY